MKIAMVFDGLQIGGVERVGADYAKILIELGHDVTIFNIVPSLTEMESQFPIQCKFVYVNFPKQICPERYNRITRYKSLGKWIFPPVSLFLTILIKVYKVFLKRRQMFRESFDLVVAFSGHYNDLTFVSEEFINSKHKIGWLHGALYSYVLISEGFLNLYRNIKNLVVLTRDCEVEFFSYNPFLSLNINQMYNPIAFFNKKISEENVQRLKEKYGDYILMVSRMDIPHKRPDTLIDAFEICWSKYGLKRNLVFVGDGPDLESIKEKAKRKDREIASHIFFEGSKMNIQDYYKSAGILVQSSSFEGLPSTVIEALQMGLPVVSTDCQTGPREILGDSQYGLLCKVGDANDMADKIYNMLTNKHLLEHYKKVGVQRGKDFYPEVIKRKLVELLENLNN